MATYYVTQSAGTAPADGSDYAHSMSVATHNATTFAEDSIIYLCGTITSQVRPPSSGTAGHPIIYRGDDAGHACTINTESTITTWTSVSGEIYSSPLATASRPNQVFINGTYLPPARWPNSAGSADPADDPPTYAYPSGNGSTTTIVDTDLPDIADTNLIGAALYLFPGYSYCREKTITAYNGTTTLTWSGAISETTESTDYYYLINDAATGASHTYATKGWMMTEGSWMYDYDNALLYVWMPGGGDPDTASTVTITPYSNLNGGIYVLNKSNITITELAVKNTYGPGIYMIASTGAQTGLTVSNCNIGWTGTNGISLDGNTSYAITGSITGCTIHDVNNNGIESNYSLNSTFSTNTISNVRVHPRLAYPREGIYLSHCTGASVLTNTISEISRNGIHNGTNSETTLISGNNITNCNVNVIGGMGAIYVPDGANVTVQNNTIVGGTTYLGITTDLDAASVIMDGNSITGCTVALSSTSPNSIIRNNKFYGPFAGGALYASNENPQIYNNYIDMVDKTGLRAIYINGDAPTVPGSVYNNTVVNSPIGLLVYNSPNMVANVENNIFYNNTTHVQTYTGVNSGTWGYNCYYGTGNWKFEATTDTVYATWKTTSSLDATGSINTNPLLTTYILLPDSPCIRAGLTIDIVTNDIDGRKRPGRPGNKYSIGAWEYLGTNDPDHDEVCRLPYR